MTDQGASSSSTGPAKQILLARKVSEATASGHHLSSAQVTPIKISSQFTQSQLALALTIQKSKPETLSTSEYCQQLKIHIKRGRNKSMADHRYVDTAEFWKDQYTKIHIEKKFLEDKVRCLKEKQRLLLQTSSLDDSQPSDRHEIQMGRPPGHLNAESQAILGALRKGVAVRDSDGENRDQHEDDIHVPRVANNTLLRLASCIFRLGRQCARLENASRSANNVDEIDELARCSSQVLLTLDSTLSECCIPFRFLRTNDGNKEGLAVFLQLMNQIGLCFLSCFKALDELCRTILGRSQKASLIYQMVMLFNKALDVLHTVSFLQAEHEAMHDSRKLRDKRSRLDEGEYAVNKHLAKMLAAVVYALDWKVHQPGHSDLLEGILFSVLEHTGRLVSEAVFSEHVATSQIPGNVSESKDIPSRSLVTKFESRYVVQILHAALGGSDKKELVTRVLATGNTNVDIQKRLGISTGLSTLKGNLLANAKKLIQSTLLKSAVGGNDLETLRLPPAPTEDPARMAGSGTVGERYGSDWLIETVWAMIGWDLVV